MTPIEKIAFLEIVLGASIACGDGDPGIIVDLTHVIGGNDAMDDAIMIIPMGELYLHPVWSDISSELEDVLPQVLDGLRKTYEAEL